MAITPTHQATFRLLRKAFQRQEAALVEHRDRHTGQPVMTICVFPFDKSTQQYTCQPVATLFDGDPLDDLYPAVFTPREED